MKEAEAKSEEIKQTVDQMMMDFGVNPDQRKDKGRSKGRNPFDQLTKEQKAQVNAKVKEIWEAGTDGREIWKQVHSMLEEFGLQAPQKKKNGQ